jgi:hypothetical protein
MTLLQATAICWEIVEFVLYDVGDARVQQRHCQKPEGHDGPHGITIHTYTKEG